MAQLTLLPLQFKRQDSVPVDIDQVFATTQERMDYLSSPRRYGGMLVADLEEEKAYILNTARTAWLELKGQVGPTGPSVTGPQGPSGIDGTIGATGPQGTILSEIPYDINFGFYDTLSPGQALGAMVLARSVRLPINLTGSVARCETAPTSTCNFDVVRNGTIIGTVSFAANQTAGTFSFSSQLTLSIGDIIAIRGNSTIFSSSIVGVFVTLVASYSLA